MTVWTAHSHRETDGMGDVPGGIAINGLSCKRDRGKIRITVKLTVTPSHSFHQSTIVTKVTVAPFKLLQLLLNSFTHPFLLSYLTSFFSFLVEELVSCGQLPFCMASSTRSCLTWSFEIRELPLTCSFTFWKNALNTCMTDIDSHQD